MHLLGKYLKEHIRIILAAGLFCVIFAVVFALYRLPIGAVFYPALLCALCAALFIISDFGRVRRKHRFLQRISGLTAAMINELPDLKTIDDEDYQAVIGALRSEVNALETNAGEQYRNMVEYYTLWAHQIKTPIASMRLHLQGEDTAFSRQLQSDLFRIEQYVEMVLAFLRLDSCSSDYVFREQPIDPIIRQAVRKFSREFIAKKISLEYEPIEKTIVTDEKWLAFVLEQVISNALKYTQEGSVKIYGKEPWILCVEDTGMGIAPEDLPRIFEKGYTGYNGRSDKRASGIGLYLCRRVCDGLGISIAANSRLGRGTVIELGLEQYRIQKD